MWSSHANFLEIIFATHIWAKRFYLTEVNIVFADGHEPTLGYLQAHTKYGSSALGILVLIQQRDIPVRHIKLAIQWMKL